MLSRNAASSRAIPTAKMLTQIRENPVEPVYWGSNKPGMQSGDSLPDEDAAAVKAVWLEAAKKAANAAELLAAAGLAKQWANRIVEPWMHWTGLVSATDWRNFFALRAHKDAQPDFQVLAYRMLKLYLENQPQELQWGDWHLPFGDQLDESWDTETKMKVCTARAARLSYMTFEGEIDVEKDKALYHQLMEAHPLHASPAEHPAVARPNLWLHSDANGWGNSYVSPERDAGYAWSWPLPYDTDMVHQGNYRGFTQWRKMQVRENAQPGPMTLQRILDERPDWISV